jgi:hypothetical protein
LNLSIETNTVLTAKMCSNRASRKVVYAFSDTLDFLFLDKKDILLNQVQACEKLLKFAIDDPDRIAVEKEIDELKSALDLLH